MPRKPVKECAHTATRLEDHIVCEGEGTQRRSILKTAQGKRPHLVWLSLSSSQAELPQVQLQSRNIRSALLLAQKSPYQVQPVAVAQMGNDA